MEDGLAILESCLRRKGSPAIAPRQEKQLTVKRDRCAGHVKGREVSSPRGASLLGVASKAEPKSLLPRLKSDRGIPSTFESLPNTLGLFGKLALAAFPRSEVSNSNPFHYFPDKKKSGLPIPLPVDRSRACPTVV